MIICVGHSSQTRSFAPAATFARVRLRNFCICKRPSFLDSRRFAKGKPDTMLIHAHFDASPLLSSISSRRTLFTFFGRIKANSQSLNGLAFSPAGEEMKG
jgi:hypothetical protein